MSSAASFVVRERGEHHWLVARNRQDDDDTMLSVILGGLIALVASVITLFIQGRQQRSLARGERLGTRRADTYVALLHYQGSGMMEDYGGPYDELTARVAAFATDDVRDLWRKSVVASLNLSEYVSEEWPQWGGTEGYEQQEVEDEMGKDETFRRFRQASVDARRRLAEQIQTELDPDRRGRNPFRRRRQALIEGSVAPERT